MIVLFYFGIQYLQSFGCPNIIILIIVGLIFKENFSNLFSIFNVTF